MPTTTLEAAKAGALERLFAIPGVTGVGLGPKIAGGGRTGELAIIVYTQVKKPLDQIPQGELIPGEIDGYKTDVIEAGPDVKLNHVPLEPLLDQQQYSTLRGGSFISGGGQDGFGTLGCIAETTSSYVSGAGRVVLLTNHHVLFSEQPNDVTPHCNKSVGQPNQSCCCPACDFWENIVAHMRSSGVASQYVDGAIAELKPGTVWRPEIQDEDASGNSAPVPIAGVVSPDLTPTDIANGYPVWKRGAKTRKTTGNITAVNYTPQNQNNPHSIVITPDPSCPYPTTAADGFTPNQVVFDYPGDSGSILMNQANQVVGLIWGAKTTGLGLACAIGHVQDELFITIKTTLNTPAGDQTVPATNDTSVKPVRKLPLDDRNTYGPSEDVFVRGADARWESMLRTPAGQNYVNLALRRRDEVGRLVNKNRRVATVWHRNGGPSILRSLMSLHDDQRLPGIVDGQPLALRLQRIAGIFERYGSDELRADIMIWRPRILALSQCSFREIIKQLSQGFVNDE